MRAFLVVNIHFMRAREVLRWRSQAAISATSRSLLPPSVHQMVLMLERAGVIKRQPVVARSIEVIVDPKLLPELL